MSGKFISGNTFKGGPTTRNVFLFRVNRDVSEDIVKDHMNGKDFIYLSMKLCLKLKLFLNSFNHCGCYGFGTIMNPEVWPHGTRLRDFMMPHGGLRFNGANKS